MRGDGEQEAGAHPLAAQHPVEQGQLSSFIWRVAYLAASGQFSRKPRAHLRRSRPTSWAGRTPLDAQSGKRTGRSRHKKGNNYLGAITGETAVATGKTQTREGARYRRLARRRGKAKAQVTVGNTQLRVSRKLLSNPGTRYADFGPDYYQRQAAIRRKIACHVREIEALGLEVTLAPHPRPRPGRNR